MKPPLASIIIPAYNAEKYIDRSLKSALGQTCRNIEVIVVDDGSTDGTADIARSFNDSRVVYLHQENQGQGAARNNGIRNSRGEYITFLDVDDLYMPAKVEKQVEFLKKHPEYGIVYCNALHYYSDNPDKLLKKKYNRPSGDIFSHLLSSSLINPNTIMLHNEILKKGFLFKEGVHGRYSEEWELYINISRAGYGFGHIDEDLVVVEIRTDSNTQWDTQWIIKKNTLEMFEKIFSGMEENEKELYQVEKILRTNKFKLAVSYLVGKQKEKFSGVIITMFPKGLAYAIMFLVLFVPSNLLSSFLIEVWKWRQQRTFSVIHDHR